MPACRVSQVSCHLSIIVHIKTDGSSSGQRVSWPGSLSGRAVALPLWPKGEEEVEQVPAETLYQGLLPSLPQYMVSALRLRPPCRRLSPPAPCPEPCGDRLSAEAHLGAPVLQIALLKILLAAAPTSKAKTDSINILADVLPEEMP